MSIGDPLQAIVGVDRMEMVGTPTLSPKLACANVLAAYIGKFVFETAPGDDGKTNKFRMNEIFPNWPNEKTELPYPCASIDEGVIGFEEHNLTPTMLEDSHNCFGLDTVLWKTSEIGVEFQVDFWLNTIAARDAVRAGLPRMFSPTEGRSGVMLSGDPRYFERSVRATYKNAEDSDDSKTSFEHERRLRTTMRCDMDVVHLRRATLLQPKPIITTTDNS